MSKRFLISVAAIALMAGAGAVNAQGMKNEGGGGAAMQQTAPSAGGGAGAAPTQKSEGMEHGKAAGGDMKSSQTEKSPGAMKNQRADDNMKGGDKSNMRSESDMKGGKDMKAEGRENNMKSEGRDNTMGREGNKAAETNKSTTSEKSTTTGQAGANAKLSTEQRTKITTVIRNQHVESVKNVNFSISVGTRVPREGVHFYPVPTEVVTIYPEWRGYEFIEVNGQIIIIEPSSYEIVAVL
jgi:hypothetical protein